MIFYATQSFAQIKCVPDSLTCITPSADIFFMSQSFTIKDLSATNDFQQKSITLLKEENTYLRQALIQKDKEISLYTLKTVQAKQDLQNTTHLLTVSERKKRAYKVCTLIVSSIAAAELSYIGLQSISK
ncbi:hypothetical protein UFOVP606_24 [uncultured Caudovirales phage]|uniref:Uncharacterized protein n=1 Tax=uncultured Caudovirales phage TaxID=2100421 RepID=A0A6J5N0Y0_9CAUD|nr:hypothetical protein UFOVP606_24 [uncultured Caudovirales phage]